MRPCLPTLGDTTLDIHLNDRAFWRNVPAAVWKYRLGGYQVLKKWFAFVGDERQSGIALEVLRTLLTGIGGYGVIHAITLASRRLMGPRE